MRISRDTQRDRWEFAPGGGAERETWLRWWPGRTLRQNIEHPTSNIQHRRKEAGGYVACVRWWPGRDLRQNIEHPTSNIQHRRREAGGLGGVCEMVAGAICGRTSNIQHRTSNIEGAAAGGW